MKNILVCLLVCCSMNIFAWWGPCYPPPPCWGGCYYRNDGLALAAGIVGLVGVSASIYNMYRTRPVIVQQPVVYQQPQPVIIQQSSTPVVVQQVTPQRRSTTIIYYPDGTKKEIY